MTWSDPADYTPNAIPTTSGAETNNINSKVISKIRQLYDFMHGDDAMQFTFKASSGVDAAIQMGGTANLLKFQGSSGGTFIAVDGSRAMRFYESEANGNNYVGFVAPTALASDKIWTLPNADGSSGFALLTNGAGSLYWGTVASGGTSGLSGTVPSLLVGSGTFHNIYGSSIFEVNSENNPLTTNWVVVNADPKIRFDIAAARGTSISSPQTVIDGDDIYNLYFYAHDDIGWEWIGDITVGVDGPFVGGDTDDVPGRISFSVNQDASNWHTPISIRATGITEIGNHLELRTDRQGGGNLPHELRFYGGSVNYVSLKAATALAGTVVWTLPLADGTVGQTLVTNGSGSLSWVSPSAETVIAAQFPGTAIVGNKVGNVRILAPYTFTATELAMSCDDVNGVGTGGTLSWAAVINGSRVGTISITPGFDYNTSVISMGVITKNDIITFDTLSIGSSGTAGNDINIQIRGNK